MKAKWTEPRYQTVTEWSEAGDKANRRKVLEDWLAIIKSRARELDETAIRILPYQMIHRTASACTRRCKRRVVMYQVFRDNNHDVDYATDLRSLAKALGPTEIQTWLQEIPLRLTQEYREVENQIRKLSSADVPRIVRQAVQDRQLFDFGESAFMRIG